MLQSLSSKVQGARQVPFKASRSVAPISCVAKPTGKPQQPQLPQQAQTLGAAAAGLLLPYLFEVQSALAKGGEYGLLEGRTFALIHPAVEGSLFLGTIYAGYLGWQWRRIRELADEIKTLKKQIPAAVEGEAPVVSPLQGQVAGLERERKELLSGNVRDKHWWMGNLLLASGTGIAIAGCANTFMRTGKLFPGPHLFAGAGIVALWAMAAALVPEMQKGNNTARNAHIVLNSINFALFAWQVPTGLEIVGKVFEFTSWP